MGIWLHLLQSNDQPYSLLFISEEGRFVLLGASLMSMREESSNGPLALLHRDMLVDKNLLSHFNEDGDQRKMVDGLGYHQKVLKGIAKALLKRSDWSF